MLQKKALIETIARWKELQSENGTLVPVEHSMTIEHAEDMLARIEEAEETGDRFSEAKLGRWLGWVQAAAVAAGVGMTLEDMKEINKSNQDVVISLKQLEQASIDRALVERAAKHFGDQWSNLVKEHMNAQG